MRAATRLRHQRHAWYAAVLVAALVTAFLASPARALIERLYSIKEVIGASKVIAEGEIESIDNEEQTLVIKVKNTVKGKCKFEKVNVNVGTGQVWHPKALLKNMKTGEPALVFYDIDGSVLPGLVYSCGLWFQIYGDLEKDSWHFVHIELLMNRAYTGAAAELIAIVKDAVAGKREPPGPNDKLPPVTREALLGEADAAAGKSSKPPPPGDLDKVDGYEDAHWSVEAWGYPAEAKLVDLPGRGKVLQISYGGDIPGAYIHPAARGSGKRNKTVVTRVVDADFSKATRLLFEASNETNAVAKLSWAFATMDWQMFECPPIELPPKARKLDLEVDLTAKNFKCAASNWQHTSALLNPQRVTKLRLFISDPPDEGALRIDRMRLDTGSPFVRSIPLAGKSAKKTSVSWVDYDGDGFYDVLICAPDGDGMRLYRNDRAEFKDVTAEAGLSGGCETAAWADYDGDGFPDLACAKPPRLFHNEKGKLADVSRLLPAMTPGNARGVAWMDVNGDGKPDLVFTNGEEGISLFLNQGSGDKRFKDVSSEWGLGKGGLGAGAGDWLTPADYDGDGFTDFLYNHGRTLLARNDEGKTFRAAADSKIVFAADQVLGMAWGDFNNDGALDVFIPQSGKSCLFRNNNDGTFTNVMPLLGGLARMRAFARTAAWGDVNRDGFLDLVVGFADGPAILYLSDGKGKFADGVPLGAFKCAMNATGMAFADADNDGDLDLLIAGEEAAGILVNACPPAVVGQPGKPDQRCVPVRVRVPRTVAPGALVRLYTAADKPLGVRQAGLVTNFNSQEPPEAFFYVPQGKYKLAVLLTNGVAKQTTVNVEEGGLVWEVPRP